uniref:Cupin type-2 domain-containing protein n=1 Tax=Tetradesmus obliquus TaxID=3088 RepID=A0A383W533_TETOB|eukprot:jgi/Sobl393_1/18528/SZX72748.1
MALNLISSSTASSRLGLVGVMLSGLCLYMQYHLYSLPRADFTGLEYFEDSSNSTGTRYRVLSRASSAGGARAELELLVRPSAAGFYPKLPGSMPYHSHAQQEESLAVLSGTMGYSLDGRAANATAGEVVLLPAGSKHTFWCSGSEGLLLRATLAPPGPMAEAFYENLAGLGATYGDVARIHPLQLVVLLQGGGVQVEDLPRVMSWAIQRLLVPFAQLLGFTASYPQYVSAGAAGLSHD